MRLLLSVAIVALLGSATGAAKTPRPFMFGLNPGTTDTGLQAPEAAGCTNVCIGAGWDRVEMKPGVYGWAHGGEREVQRCLEYGLEPFFLLVATPSRALALEKREPEPNGRVHLKVDFERFRVVDWGIGHDISLPEFGPEDAPALMRPRNDGGNWDPFYWEKSAVSRSGQSLAIRLVRPSNGIRGCGADLWLRGKYALPPDKDITVSVWTNCSRQQGDFTTIVLGWQPGDFEGTMGGIQEYVKLDRRRDETGWKRQTLTFHSHSDPEVGDVIGLAFAGHTTRDTEFRCDDSSKKSEDCKDVVAVQPTLSAYFDDLVISVAD
jgi:hypothetical protein